MKKHNNSIIVEIVEFAALLLLLFVRIFIQSNQNTWIDLLNFIGLALAGWSLYIGIRSDCLKYKKFSLVTGFFVIVLLVWVIFFCFILVGKLSFSDRINDVILIITLLLTLPARLYKRVMVSIIKD